MARKVAKRSPLRFPGFQSLHDLVASLSSHREWAVALFREGKEIASAGSSFAFRTRLFAAYIDARQQAVTGGKVRGRGKEQGILLGAWCDEVPSDDEFRHAVLKVTKQLCKGFHYAPAEYDTMAVLGYPVPSASLEDVHQIVQHGTDLEKLRPSSATTNRARYDRELSNIRAVVDGVIDATRHSSEPVFSETEEAPAEAEELVAFTGAVESVLRELRPRLETILRDLADRSEPQAGYETKKLVARITNRAMSLLGARVKCPVTGEPALVHAFQNRPGSTGYRIDRLERSKTGFRMRTSKSYKSFPQIELVDAPPRGRSSKR